MRYLLLLVLQVVLVSTSSVFALTANFQVEPGLAVVVGQEVFFNAITTTDNSSLDDAVFSWNFGDKTVRDAFGISSTHFFSYPGVFTTTLTVVDADTTETKTVTKVITVTGSYPKLPPNAATAPLLSLSFENNLTDASSSGKNASGSATYATGIGKQVLTLAGGNRITVPSFSNLNGANALTVSFWARRIDPNIATDQHLLYLPGVFDMWIKDKGAGFYGKVITTNGEKTAPQWYQSSEYSARNALWHHYAMVYDGSHIHLYTDGYEEKQTEAGRILPQPQTGRLGNASDVMYFGTTSSSAAVANIEIDEVKIYNVSLSSHDIFMGFELLHGNFHGHLRQSIFVQIPSGIRSNTANRLKMTLSDNGSYSDVLVNKSNLQAEERVIINHELLPVGDYTLTAQLLSSTNTILDEVVESFHKGFTGTPVTCLDENGSILLHGELFFPVTPYSISPEDIPTWKEEGYINTLHSTGFNMALTTSGWAQYMQYGVDVGLPAIGPGKWERPDNDRNSDIGVLVDYVNTFKDNDAHIMWQWGDEPDLGGEDICLPATVLRTHIYKSHTNDPKRLVATGYVGNFYRSEDDWGARHRRPFVYMHNATTFGKRTMLADVTGFDYYPVEWAAPSWRNASVAELMTITDQLRADVYDLAPLLSAVETGDVKEPDYGTSWYPTPWSITPTQLKMITWASVIHGVKGILWFPWQGGTPAENYPVMAEFVDHITRLTPVVLGPKSDLVTSITATGGARIDHMVKEYNNTLYLFATRISESDTFGNTMGQTETATITLPSGITPPRLAVFEEDRLITISGGRFTDTFVPGDVHIYKISMGDSVLIDMDEDGYYSNQSSPLPAVLDCNDRDADVFPGATELCDGVDNDCNTIIDDGFSTQDDDADGLVFCIDNCPNVYNPYQADFDADGLGDTCDAVYTYYEDFTNRVAGTTDLDTHKVLNDFTWNRLIGGGGVSNTNNKSLGSDIETLDMLTVTDQVFGQFTLEFTIGIAWAGSEISDDGLYLHYQDAQNFYYFTLGNDSRHQAFSGSRQFGALYRVVNNVGTLLGQVKDLKVNSGTVEDKCYYKITTSMVGATQEFAFYKKTLHGDSTVTTHTFVDASPQFTFGAFGFGHKYQKYNHLQADNFKVETGERPDTNWYKPASLNDDLENSSLGCSPDVIRLSPLPCRGNLVIQFHRSIEGVYGTSIHALDGSLVSNITGNTWNGCNTQGAKVASGMYYVRIKTATKEFTKSFIVTW